ncbi:hypothetical protein STEG23_013266, partial [Scotinomys teguina]
DFLFTSVFTLPQVSNEIPPQQQNVKYLILQYERALSPKRRVHFGEKETVTKKLTKESAGHWN